MCLEQKSKNNNNKQKIKHKNPCQRQELNTGPLAPQWHALPLNQVWSIDNLVPSVLCTTMKWEGQVTQARSIECCPIWTHRTVGYTTPIRRNWPSSSDWIVVKLFNCFNAMSQNVNKQSQSWPHIFNNFFSVIF